MKILALEFSSPRRSVAVLDGANVLAEQAEPAGASVPPLRLIAAALAAAGLTPTDIGGLAIGLGPGSYNGIRGAIALAQGWQLASGVKLIGVSCAECIAVRAQAEGLFGRIGVVIDAQRGEFYLATHEISDKTIKTTSDLIIVTLPELNSVVKSGYLPVGPEVTKWFPEGRVILPDAANLGRLAAARTDFIPGEALEPIYLRATSFVKAPPARNI